MARRVRFLSLTLTGFGRYERPTRFQLAGQSVTFTSPNELGKSTFLEGLLATLFGPPAGRGKAAEFQHRFRTWTNPDQFWGQLDLTVDQSQWRVRRDFDRSVVQVWQLESGREPLLALRQQGRAGRKKGDPTAYAQLLDQWLGFNERSLYEAMFTMTQHSTVATAWQIDPRISCLVYGRAVERLDADLQVLFRKFRLLTRHTRQHQVQLGSQGLRDGRSAGRLDQVTAQIAEQQAAVAEAEQKHRQLIEASRRLEEAEQQAAALRRQLDQTTSTLGHWQTWLELENQLQPAIEDGERLSQLCQECEQIERQAQPLRDRLSTIAQALENAPEDLPYRLDQLIAIEHELEQTQRRREWAEQQRGAVQDRLERLRDHFDRELAQHRDRPQLPEQVARLHELEQRMAAGREDVERQRREHQERCQAAAAELQPLAPWLEAGPDWHETIEQARQHIEQFVADHQQYLAAEQGLEDEHQRQREVQERLTQLEMERMELEQQRAGQRSAIAAQLQQVHQTLHHAEQLQKQLDRDRQQLQRQFAQLQEAPANLPELWDRHHQTESRLADTEAAVRSAALELRLLVQRDYWRHAASSTGGLLILLCVLGATGWLDWAVAAVSLLLIAVAQWWFRPDRPRQQRLDDQLNQSRHEAARLRAQLRALTEQIGPRYIVPPNQQTAWRQLWPDFQGLKHQLQQLQAQLPPEDELTDLRHQADELKLQLERYDAETDRLLDRVEADLEQTRRQLLELEQNLEQLQTSRQAHCEAYFGSDPQRWSAEPLQALPAGWEAVLALAKAAQPELDTVGDLAHWCQSLNEEHWQQFAEACGKAAELQARLQELSDPDGRHLAAIREQEEELRRSEQAAGALSQSIAPFNAETDPDWLRRRRCQALAVSAQIAALERQLADIPDPEPLAQTAAQLHRQHNQLLAPLQPHLEPFHHDAEQLKLAGAERAELQQRLAELEDRLAATLTQAQCDHLDQLQSRTEQAQAQVGTIRQQAQLLLQQTEELWLAVDDPELAERRIAELETQRNQQQIELEQCEQQRAELAVAAKQLQAHGAGDLDRLQQRLAELQAERAELEAERDRIVNQFQEAQRLMQELQQRERQALQQRITEYFAEFSRTPGRYIELDQTLSISVRNEDGTRYRPDRLSHGARDQLYLAIYLATAADFDLPFLLDDPFVNCDADRLAAIRSCWQRLAPHHQLILLSHDPNLANWSPALQISQAA